MKNYICTTCGTQFAATSNEPEHCPICEDERQYVNPNGQQWTMLSELQKEHKLIFHKQEEHLFGMGMTPDFAIGQRALLLQTRGGNVLWDCISLINETAVDIIHALGGLDAIAISHPHYYSSMVEWSQAFGNIPIYLHKNDRQWVQRNDKSIVFWSGDSRQILDEVFLHKPGGHFPGGAILHWPEGAGGAGALLTGDILQVGPGRRHLSFMYSYPNNIPLNARAVKHISDIVAPLQFNRIYGAWWNRNILEGAKDAVSKSIKRYLKAIE